MSSNQIIVLVCAIYFLTMVATGIFAARRNKKASDFLVAGRGLNTPMTAVTLAAVQIGVGIVLSGATNGYMTASGRVSIMRSDAAAVSS